MLCCRYPGAPWAGDDDDPLPGITNPIMNIILDRSSYNFITVDYSVVSPQSGTPLFIFITILILIGEWFFYDFYHNNNQCYE